MFFLIVIRKADNYNPYLGYTASSDQCDLKQQQKPVWQNEYHWNIEESQHCLSLLYS